MAVRFNGTQVSLGAVALNPVSVRVETGEATADVTTSVSTEGKGISGLPDRAVDVEVKGCPAQAHGATGALSVSWQTGGTIGAFDSAVVTRVTCRGRRNGPIDGSVRFRKVHT